MLIATTNDLPGYTLEEVYGGRGRGEGANAILAMRFDTSELGGVWTEICAYGTAVRVRRA